MLRRSFLATALLSAFACAAPPQAPIAVDPITPGSGERVVVTHSVLVVDASESVDELFASEKALVQSFVAAKPAGSYEAGSVAFGGFARDTQALAGFDRSQFASGIDGIEHLSEGTPLDQVFTELAGELGGKSGQAAVVVWSDGVPTTGGGKPVEEQAVLDAAAALSDAYSGAVCIHTVHVGDDAAGADFLDRLANASGCGSARAAGSLTTAGALQGMAREVYLARAGAPTPKAVGDVDRDGIRDDQDQCPGTPLGVNIDGRGCWVLGVRFAFDSAEIHARHFDELNQAATRITEVGANADVKVAVDGHTDSRGADAYNQQLSERRANSVRDYLVKQGVPAEMLVARGFGESKPAYTNDTDEGRAGNRRTELTRL